MNIKKYLVVLPGIILAFVLYTLSQGFNNILGIELLGLIVQYQEYYWNLETKCKEQMPI